MIHWLPLNPHLGRENSHLLLAKHSPVIQFETTRWKMNMEPTMIAWIKNGSSISTYVDFMMSMCQMFQVATYLPQRSTETRKTQGELNLAVRSNGPTLKTLVALYEILIGS